MCAGLKERACLVLQMDLIGLWDHDVWTRCTEVHWGVDYSTWRLVPFLWRYPWDSFGMVWRVPRIKVVVPGSEQGISSRPKVRESLEGWIRLRLRDGREESVSEPLGFLQDPFWFHLLQPPWHWQVTNFLNYQFQSSPLWPLLIS